ncbi:hypothetical protein HMPREF1548_05496 [Clostridium sp. KLE 1755]|nr:hypothetical protein HMPREF1548_05496 [Clostridium sp. KLE 1755]
MPEFIIFITRQQKNHTFHPFRSRYSLGVITTMQLLDRPR